MPDALQPTTSTPKNISQIGKVTLLDAQTRAEIFGGVAATIQARKAEEAREVIRECEIHGISLRLNERARAKALEKAKAEAEFRSRDAMREMALVNRTNAAMLSKVG